MPHRKTVAFVGLGNPGGAYFHTRHNAGAWWIEACAKQYEAELTRSTKFKSMEGKFILNQHTCYLLFPETFMNLSGTIIPKFLNFYKIPLTNLIVIHDDLDLKPGIIRLKQGGSSQGHNGLANIILHLGTGDFTRLRVGIGQPSNSIVAKNYVLSPPSIDDKISIDKAIDASLQLLNDIIQKNWQKVMNILHRDIA